jgi:two-component system, NtrC family, sensor kinase
LTADRRLFTTDRRLPTLFCGIEPDAPNLLQSSGSPVALCRFHLVLTLLVIQGPDKGRRFELPDSPALIGRDSRQLPLDDNTVSRRHAELIPGDGDWTLKDLGSSNGTYVNGQRVFNTYQLKPGDQIRVGRSLLVFGAQPGMARGSGGAISLAGEESGMDSSIMHAVPSNDDSMVLAVPEPAAAAMANLKILYRLGSALGSSFDVQQVLEVVMDLIFEHVRAERGIIMLLGKSGDLEPRVVRLREEEARADPGGSKSGLKIHASRTIIDHVMQKGEGVLSSNAMADKRFSKGKSVHDLGIRSALCVPIKSRRLDSKVHDKAAAAEEPIGVIYIDSSVKNYTYSPDQLRLLATIGLQAGMAIQNAKLYTAQLQAERMMAIGETVAALSHSIKNILQALRGGADVVEMGLRNNNTTQLSKGWRVVDRNLEKIYNLTMNLLAFSKDRQPQLDLVNVRQLVNDCLELIAPMANEKGVMCVADLEDQMPPVPMDPDGIHQVLMNLLSNAIDAVEAGKGLIRVVARYEPDTRVTVLEVVDNGSGISPSMKNHLFELFHSTKGNKGTGIGLAVTKKIVEEHEGSITVKSSADEGTTFTIRLPTNPATAHDPATTHGPTARHRE